VNRLVNRRPDVVREVFPWACPLNVIGHAIGGVFGWTFWFIVALHIGMFIGLSTLGHGTAHPFIMVLGVLFIAIRGLAGSIG